MKRSRVTQIICRAAMLAAVLYLFFIGLLVDWISKTDFYLRDSTPDSSETKIIEIVKGIYDHITVYS